MYYDLCKLTPTHYTCRELLSKCTMCMSIFISYLQSFTWSVEKGRRQGEDSMFQGAKLILHYFVLIASYAEANGMLTKTEVLAPVYYILGGNKSGEVKQVKIAACSPQITRTVCGRVDSWVISNKYCRNQTNCKAGTLCHTSPHTLVPQGEGGGGRGGGGGSTHNISQPLGRKNILSSPSVKKN